METRNVVEFIDEYGNSPFAQWFSGISAQAAARVATALYRLERGNLSNTKSVGKGVYEYKIDFGPGYRIYFGQDGNVLVILLNGGIKKRQNTDIKRAQERWANYKKRKKKM